MTGGTFKVALTSSGSYLRLGSSPDGPVTVDLLGDAFGGFVSDAASVMRRVLERRLSSAQLALATFSGLAARLPGAIGIVFSSVITVAEAVRQICNGTYTTLAPLPDGRLAVDQIADPYDGGMAIDATHLRDVPSPAALPDIISPCVWRLYVQYRRNWTQLGDSDVVPVPTITAAERAEILRQFRLTGKNDPDRLKGHAGARDIIFESLFDAEADAYALAVYMFNLFRPGRTLWVLPLANIGHSIMAGANLHVTWPRGELVGGKNMRVIGKSLEGRAVNLLALA